MATVDEDDCSVRAIRASGPGGQHVNKTSTAIELRFDIAASRLSDDVKQRLLARRDQRLNADGEIVIKSQNARSQEANRRAAIERLQALVDQAAQVPKARRATKPSKAAKERRLQSKKANAERKKLRKSPPQAD